jgi:prevent-host-death family protein
MTTAQARQNLSDVLNRTAYGKQRVVLTRRGRPVAAVVPMEDLATIEALENKADLRAAARAKAEIAKRGVVRWPDLKRDLGLP